VSLLGHEDGEGRPACFVDLDPRDRGELFRWSYSIRQYRSSRRPRGQKNLHRVLIFHAVFLARNLRPHYSAFISMLERPPLALSSVLAFFIFPSLSSFLSISLSFNLFCTSTRHTRENLSRRPDGFSAIFRPAVALIGRLPRAVMNVEILALRTPAIIHEGFKVAA